jgi:hypothetical protein
MPSDSSEEDVERRTQFMHDLAAVLAVWAELEMVIEVKIANLTGMKPLDASIVLGSLQSGTRKNILFSLLKERGEKAAISKVKSAISFAKRNMLVHSQFAAAERFTGFRLYQREVKDAYKVTSHDFTAETFHQHFVKFRQLFLEARDALGVRHRHIEKYAHEARFAGLGE